MTYNWTLVIPNESMYAWKGDTFLDLSDMLEYVLTRDQAELDTWLLDRERMIYDTATRNFRLQVKESIFTKVENRGIRALKPLLLLVRKRKIFTAL